MTLWRWAPLIGLLVWGAWKLVGWGAVPWETSAQVGALLNLFIIVVLAFGGAWVKLRAGEVHPDFLTAFREASKAPLRFALLAAAGLFVWYGTVASDGLDARRDRMKSEAQALVEDDAQWAAFVEAQGGGEWNREAALEQQLATIDTIFDERLFLGLSLLGLVIAALVASAVATVLWRSVWAK